MLTYVLDRADMFLYKSYILSFDLFGGEDNTNSVNWHVRRVHFLAFFQRWDESLALAEKSLKISNSIQGAISETS